MTLQSQKLNKVFCFDIDGVIVDHALLKIQIASELGFDIAPEHTPSEIIKTVIPAPALNEIKFCIYHKPETALSAPLMKGALHGLKKIKASGFDYFLISRRRDADAAVELLKRRRIWPDYFNEKNTFFVLKPEDKDVQAKRLDITHYVDDELEILDALASVRHKFLFDPFNAFSEHSYIQVASWQEILGKLLK